MEVAMNQIRFAGYDAIHSENFIFDLPTGHDCFLFLFTHTKALFEVNGVVAKFPKGSAILYPPGHKIYYRACETTYGNDWIRFESDETFVTNFPVQGTPFLVSDPEYCHALIKLITWETAFQTVNSETIIENLLHALFLKMKEDSIAYKTLYHFSHEKSPHEHSLISLRKDIFNNPQHPWNVATIAKQLHISEGYFHSLYKKTFGISVMDDVIEGRIRIAKDHLHYTEKNITEIAELCGYHNTEHFCRQFRKKTGVSPGQYRKSSLLLTANAPSEFRTVSGSEFQSTAHILTD